MHLRPLGHLSRHGPCPDYHRALAPAVLNAATPQRRGGGGRVPEPGVECQRRDSRERVARTFCHLRTSDMAHTVLLQARLTPTLLRAPKRGGRQSQSSGHVHVSAFNSAKRCVGIANADVTRCPGRNPLRPVSRIGVPIPPATLELNRSTFIACTPRYGKGCTMKKTLFALLGSAMMIAVLAPASDANASI